MKKKINLNRYIAWSIGQFIYMLFACYLLVKDNTDKEFYEFAPILIIIVAIMTITENIFGEKFYIESDKEVK